MPVAEIKEMKFPLTQIYFYLTEGCNLRCRHCWLAPKHHSSDHPLPVLDPALFRAIIGQAKPLGLSVVKLTGGEPLIHPGIGGILETVASEDLSLTVETNGTRCTPELARAMARCRNANVSVSLDGPDAEGHEWVRGVAGSFEDSLEGVRNLVRAGLAPQIIMSVMRRNRDQLEEVVKLAESLGAGSVKFNPVQPIARGALMHESGEALGIEELVEIGAWVENTLSGKTVLPLYYSHPPAFRPLSKLMGSKTGGCGACGILGIIGVLPDGSYALCGIGETVPELVFGHVAADRLEDVWNGNKLLQELREGIPRRFEGICGQCLMKSACLGNCLAQTYYSNKNFWEPYWYCDLARQKGLFPVARMRPHENLTIK